MVEKEKFKKILDDWQECEDVLPEKKYSSKKPSKDDIKQMDKKIEQLLDEMVKKCPQKNK